MIDFLRSIWDVLTNAVLSMIQIITDIPYYISSFEHMVSVLDIFGASTIYNVFIVVISIGIAIKIKRLLF